MASIIYNATMRFIAIGSIDFDTDSFKVMLTTSSYTPSKDADDFRNDVTNEVSGAGYTTGGAATTATVAAVDTTNDDVEVSFSTVTWTTATITAARYAVIYKSRGGASSADELVACVDLGADKSSSAADFVLTFTSPFKFQNGT